MVIFQRAPLFLRCPALFSCCSATKIMRIWGVYWWKCAMVCFFSSRALPSLLLNSVRKMGDLIHVISFHRTILEALIISRFFLHLLSACSSAPWKGVLCIHLLGIHIWEKKPTMMQKSWKHTDFPGRTTTTTTSTIFTCSFLRFWLLWFPISKIENIDFCRTQLKCDFNWRSLIHAFKETEKQITRGYPCLKVTLRQVNMEKIHCWARMVTRDRVPERPKQGSNIK